MNRNVNMIIIFYVIVLVLIMFYYFNKIINNTEPFLSPEKTRLLYDKHKDNLKGSITYSDFNKDVDYFNQTTEVIGNNRTIEL